MLTYSFSLYVYFYHLLMILRELNNLGVAALDAGDILTALNLFQEELNVKTMEEAAATTSRTKPKTPNRKSTYDRIVARSPIEDSLSNMHRLVRSCSLQQAESPKELIKDEVAEETPSMGSGDM